MSLITLALCSPVDVAVAREKARVAASALGLDGLAQIRMATAASELARAVIEFGNGGEFSIERTGEHGASLALVFRGRSGRLALEDQSWDPVRAAELLADSLSIEREPAWPVVARFIKHPRPGGAIDFTALERALRQENDGDALKALVAQNRELVRLLTEQRARDEELARVNEELTRANAAAAAANARLEDMARRKDELLATIAHDLRSPLSAVRGAIDLLADSGGLSDQQSRYLAIAGRASRHIVELVNDILDSALLDAGLLRLERRPLLLHDVLSETRSTIGFLAQEKGLKLTLDVPTDLLVDADAARLSQVVQNLLSNAVKFTDAGGKVTLRAWSAVGVVKLTVSDSGLGIPPERMSTLFDRSGPSHTRGTRGERGTGLGLFICRQLVELHGGTLAVESALGRGTTFLVTLPAHDSSLLSVSPHGSQP
jgi:signal transduction histidine kinase